VVVDIGQDRRILPGRQTQSYSLLELIAITGELPTNQIKRLPGGDRYKEEKIKSLKGNKLIHTYYRDKLRGYRLTAAAREMLLADNPARFQFYLTGNTETNSPKYEITRRLRLHRIAETYITMRNAGAAIFRDAKPDVFSPEGGKAHSYTVESPAFYSSREIKGYGLEFVKIRGARTVGTLLTENIAYVVYNTGSSLMKWNYKSEIRTKALMKTIILRRLQEQYQPESVQGLILGDNMETAYLLMTSTGGVKRDYFVLDGNYDNFHYITNDHGGEVLLKLLCNPPKTAELNRLLSGSLYERDPGWIIENDAIDENGEPVLFAYSFDMPRLVRFNSALQLQGKRGTVICFDYQADVLRRYCCGNARFQTIDLQKFEGRFFP